MSRDDQFLAMGRTMTEYAEIRKILAALYVESDRLGRELETLSFYLVENPSNHLAPRLKNGATLPDLSDYPTAEEIRQLSREILTAQRRKRELYASLKEFGMEPKERVMSTMSNEGPDEAQRVSEFDFAVSSIRFGDPALRNLFKRAYLADLVRGEDGAFVVQTAKGPVNPTIYFRSIADGLPWLLAAMPHSKEGLIDTTHREPAQDGL